MNEMVPILIALLTAVAGMVTYLFQKKADRKNDLIKLRQQEYRKFIAAFQNNVEKNTPESLGAYHEAMYSLFVVASDPVIRAVGDLNAYLALTSAPSANRDVHKIGDLLADMFREMRKDCFEKSHLQDDEVKNLLPIAGIRS